MRNTKELGGHHSLRLLGFLQGALVEIGHLEPQRLSEGMRIINSPTTELSHSIFASWLPDL